MYLTKSDPRLFQVVVGRLLKLCPTGAWLQVRMDDFGSVGQRKS